jgi:BAG domain
MTWHGFRPRYPPLAAERVVPRLYHLMPFDAALPEAPGTAPVTAAPTITVIHGKQRHVVWLHATVGELRRAVAVETGVPPPAQVLICGGKKLTAAVADDTPVFNFKLAHGKKVMLQAAVASTGTGSGTSGGLRVSENVAKVRVIDSEVSKIEGDLETLLARLGKLRLGFLDKYKTVDAAARLRTDCKVVEEALMRHVLAADAMTGGDDCAEDAQWRAERKALVQRINAALRRCDDDIQSRLHELVEDEFDEMKHRRGKPS